MRRSFHPRKMNLEKYPQLTRITINKKRLLQIVPLSYTTIYELERKGEFPASFLLTEKTRVWYLDEIEQWVEKRRKTPIANGKLPDVRKRRTNPVRRAATSA